MPLSQEKIAPLQVEVEFLIWPNGTILLPKTSYEVNHMAAKCSAWPYHLSSMMKMANTRFEFAPEAPFPRQPRMNQLLQSLYCSFPSGRCATWARESNSMPRAANTGVGPTHLPGWRGKPKRSQTNSAVLRFCAHWEESEGPAVTKSSK